MKDGIGKGYTREDHQDLANQLFSLMQKLEMPVTLPLLSARMSFLRLTKNIWNLVKNLKPVTSDKALNENRTIEETLDLGWELLGRLPKEELDRVDTKFWINTIILCRLRKN